MKTIQGNKRNARLRTLKVMVIRFSILVLAICGSGLLAKADRRSFCKCRKQYYGCQTSTTACYMSCSFQCGAMVTDTAAVDVSLSKSQWVSLKVFDVAGRLIETVADGIFEDGDHEFLWSTSERKNGVYFLRFQSGENLVTEKLIVMN